MTKPSRKAGGHARLGIIIGLVLAAGLAAWGLFSRHQAMAQLRTDTNQAAIPTVTLVQTSAEPAIQEFVLPGAVAANYDAPIYARTDGYVKQWFTGIGTRVKAGQTLAVLETPDVDDELRQAIADLGTAQANNALSQSTARRWRDLRSHNAVSQQDLDEKLGDAAAKQASVAAAQANVARLRQLQDFKNVVAPFDGVVTARLTDVGALVTSGTSNVLFRVADTSRLRIYVNVPELQSSAITLGTSAELTFGEYPGRVFPATIARTAQALDPATRTLQVELDLDNANGELLPGGYAQVHFHTQTTGNFVRIPVSALLFRADGLHVAAVTRNADGATGQIALKNVTIGQDFGTSLEISSGLQPGQTIILDPPDSAIDGETVRFSKASTAGTRS